MSRKTILITGTSSGFGLLTARLALERGWRVAATARRPERIPLPPQDGLRILRLDVTEEASVEAAIAGAEGHFGVLDAVVNNAGMAYFGPAEEIPGEALRVEFETNFFGAVAVTRHALPCMRRRGAGQLVFVSSDWGRTGIPCFSGYCASKHAMEGWAESLAHEVRPFGVGVTLVEPGAYATGFKSAEPHPRSAESPYDVLVTSVERGFQEEDDEAPTGEPVAEAILRAAAGEEPRLRVPVGKDAIEWCSARFRESEEEFITGLARRYGWNK
jgi:NAD(P)-dependent dehydrogenase (short-subunit alcohol dehydrogenase family)